MSDKELLEAYAGEYESTGESIIPDGKTDWFPQDGTEMQFNVVEDPDDLYLEMKVTGGQHWPAGALLETAKYRVMDERVIAKDVALSATISVDDELLLSSDGTIMHLQAFSDGVRSAWICRPKT